MKIKFKTDDELLKTHWPPMLAKDMLPSWYTGLQGPRQAYKFDENAVRNIHACLPVDDLLNSGYIIRTGYETRIQEKLINFIPQMTITTASPTEEKYKQKGREPGTVFVKTEQEMGLHSSNPVNVYFNEACPAKIQDKKSPSNYFKFTTDWSIITPPGYSCLIMQPYYFFRTDINIMPAIIDTDKFHEKIPVVGFMTGTDSEARFVAGDPLLQIIPFKRDSWESEIEAGSILKQSKFYLYNIYQRMFHTPKEFK